MKEKARCPKVFVFVKGYAEVSGVRNGAKLSGWMVDASVKWMKLGCVVPAFYVGPIALPAPGRSQPRLENATWI